MDHVSSSPPLIPNGRISRVRLAAAAFPREPSHTSRGLNARPYTPLVCMVITLTRRPLRLAPVSGPVSRWCFLYDARRLPRAPLPVRGVTSSREVSSTSSAGVTQPSSLILAHAPHQEPPDVFGFPYTPGLCRLLRAPAGNWWLPTLSPQSLHRCLDPYPAATYRCSCPFLPGRLRPHDSYDSFGSQILPHHAISSGGLISGLQSFDNLQAPMLARPAHVP